VFTTPLYLYHSTKVQILTPELLQNCVGANNTKYFILFLTYGTVTCVYYTILVAYTVMHFSDGQVFLFGAFFVVLFLTYGTLTCVYYTVLVTYTCMHFSDGLVSFLLSFFKSSSFYFGVFFRMPGVLFFPSFFVVLFLMYGTLTCVYYTCRGTYTERLVNKAFL